jgi:hypothetical protein
VKLEADEGEEETRNSRLFSWRERLGKSLIEE